MRQWVGTVLSALAFLAGTAWSTATDHAWWVFAIIAVVTLTSAVIQAPVLRREPPQPDPRVGSATFRGNMSNVRVTNVYSEADSVVDGDTRDSIIDRIRHRPRRNGEQ